MRRGGFKGAGKWPRSRAANTQYFRDYRKKFPLLCKFQSMRTNSKTRGLPFVLTWPEFRDWYQKQPDQCEYCEVVDLSVTEDGPMGELRLFTIDRKNSALPYQIGNISKSCWSCNRLKNDFFTYDEWKEIAMKYVRPKWLAKMPRVAV